MSAAEGDGAGAGVAEEGSQQSLAREGVDRSTRFDQAASPEGDDDVEGGHDDLYDEGEVDEFEPDVSRGKAMQQVDLLGRLVIDVKDGKDYVAKRMSPAVQAQWTGAVAAANDSFTGDGSNAEVLKEKARVIGLPVTIKDTEGHSARVVHTEKKFMGLLDAVLRDARGKGSKTVKIVVERYVTFDASSYQVGTQWNQADMVAFLPTEKDAADDVSGIQQKPKPFAHAINWQRLQERLLRDHWWEMKHSAKASKWDRSVAFDQYLHEAGTSRLEPPPDANNVVEPRLPTPWLDARRRYLNVMSDPLRPPREGWLRNPPRRGAESTEEDEWPEGLVRKKNLIDGDRDNSTPEPMIRLTIEVLSLRFLEHGLYTEENSLSLQLSELYQVHTEAAEDNSLQYLRDKLETLKSAIGFDPDGAQAKQYRKEIRATREKMDTEMQDIKDRERQMRDLWNKIKQVRVAQGEFNSASMKMGWKKRTINAEAEQRELDDEIQERLDEYRAEYDAKVQEFDEHIKKLEKLKLDKELKMADAEKAKDEVNTKKYASNISKIDERMALLQQKNPASRPFSDEKNTAHLKEQYQKLRLYMPEEDHYVAVMQSDPIDDAAKCPREEQDRRKKIKATEFFVKLEVDQQLLKSRSAKMPMASSAESQIDLGERVTLAVAKPPSHVFAVIYESGLWGDKEIAKVPIEIPVGGSAHACVLTSSKKMVFAGTEQFERTVTEETESGSFTTRPATLFTRGELRCRVTWDTTALKEALAAAGATVGGDSGTANLPPELRGAALHDPNNPMGDPNNPGLFGTQHQPTIFEHHPTELTIDYTASGNVDSEPKFFRLVNDDAEVNFIKRNTDEERRNKLLHMRDEGKIDMAGREAIPMRNADIGEEWFVPDDVDVLNFPKKQAKVKKMTAAQIRKQELKEQAGAGAPKVRMRDVWTADMVNEPELPLFRVDFDWLFSFFAPRNPLRPKYTERKPKRGLTKTTVVVQVVSAINVPVRDTARPGEEDVTPAAESEGHHWQRDGSRNIKSFVEVKFGHNEERTATKRGNAPIWNDTLHLPWEGTNVLYENRELEFNLFDEVVVRVEDDGQLGSLHVERREKRWLASFNLPFQTVYRHQAINGAVPMKIPIFNLGYKLVEPTAPVSILFYATLDPPLHPPAAKEDHAASSEEARLQKDVLRFMKELEKNEFTAKRRIEILVPTSNGQTAFVTRYIHPQTLPPTCSTDETAARYVTLVPFVEDSNEDGDAVDMWQTSREFLETQSGDWEEHAILMCNYFLMIKKQRKAYVVLGTAIPDGMSAYVLTDDDGVQKLHNPCDGQVYDVNDSSCPLKDISMIFNNDNVWANIGRQTSGVDQICKVIKLGRGETRNVFDLEDTAIWKTFFSEKGNQMSEHDGLAMTCQPDNGVLQYYNPDMETLWTDAGESAAQRKKMMSKMEQSLKRELEPLFEGWRDADGVATQWMRAGDVTQAMKATLLGCETERRGELDLAADGIHLASGESKTAELHKLQDLYRVNGFPINQTWMGDHGPGIGALSKYLHGTDTHENHDPDTQFALAVKCHLYPNRIISVWVLALSLVKR